MAVSLTFKDPASEPKVDDLKVGVTVKARVPPFIFDNTSSKTTEVKSKFPVFATVIV